MDIKDISDKSIISQKYIYSLLLLLGDQLGCRTSNICILKDPLAIILARKRSNIVYTKRSVGEESGLVDSVKIFPWGKKNKNKNSNFLT